ncbi:unnamed protein product [Polarella glacialis]|uniref:Nucleotide-diphospho-sugar transferase domain-containing protein n=1 Tax=Polarella glacialis TaxID=89957 RepID=A0A813FAN6_POLGL|nr:unnamed protein product [Polarella glacialis]
MMGDMVKEAQTAPEITQVHVYTKLPEEIMSDARWATHVKPKVRGRGYWFWKSALANLLIAKNVIRLGDDLLYVDTDSIGMMKHILKISKSDKSDVIIASQSHCEHVWTKGDIFEQFGTTWDDPHYGLSQQPKAQAYMMRINERTLKLLRLWEDLMTDFHLVSDEPSRNASLNGPWFAKKENRHDQSILSMLIKASIPKSGRCGEPDFPKAERLTNDEDESRGWKLHPKYGVEGLKVRFI